MLRGTFASGQASAAWLGCLLWSACVAGRCQWAALPRPLTCHHPSQPSQHAQAWSCLDPDPLVGRHRKFVVFTGTLYELAGLGALSARAATFLEARGKSVHISRGAFDLAWGGAGLADGGAVRVRGPRALARGADAVARPALDVAAMDGRAVRGSGLWRVIGRTLAGQSRTRSISARLKCTGPVGSACDKCHLERDSCLSRPPCAWRQVRRTHDGFAFTLAALTAFAAVRRLL